ncbi:MAG: AAA family ATPase [Gammaproteobacteria bacterium]|nr:AAA family ATPase [Gammaproteobacteria bacterium]
MEFAIEKLSPVQNSVLKLGKLTVICGTNNTGKSYVAYATYGFLQYFREYETPLNIEIFSNEERKKLLQEGQFRLPTNEAVERIFSAWIKTSHARFPHYLGTVVTGGERFPGKAKFEFSKIFIESMLNYVRDQKIADQALDPGSSFPYTGEIKGGDLIIRFNPENNNGDGHEERAEWQQKEYIEQSIRRLLFPVVDGVVKLLVPKAFIVSAERTGAAIFQTELDFTRSRIVEILNNKPQDIDPFQFLGKFSSRYPLPVKNNIDYIRRQRSADLPESELSKNHPKIIEYFNNIIGGEYKIDEGGFFYIPKTGRHRLSMTESSSSIRSLLILGLYLKHTAKIGDLLIIDEPELNLHPSNQRLLARLLAKLVNVGIQVFITTHSDFIVKEINILLALNQEGEKFTSIKKQYEYSDEELLQENQVQAYLFEEDTTSEKTPSGEKNYILKSAPISQDEGIVMNGFNESISNMNIIYDKIFWD